ncbi:MAG: hypothetical protein HY927_16910 [Elusimicrobia bacterium]|nr:hypothetical protein [Elusimicrobiota bacterium]
MKGRAAPSGERRTSCSFGDDASRRVAFGGAAWGVAAAIGLIHVLTALGRPFCSNTDEALFILLARSLTQGSYALPGGLSQPATDPLPGLPAILALPVRLLEPHWELFWVVGLAFSAAVFVLTWRLARRLLSPEAACAATALTMLNVPLVGHAGMIDDAVPALALTLAVLGGLARPLSTRSALALAAGGSLIAMIRPTGLLLVLAVAAVIFARRGRRLGLTFLAPALTVFALWMLRNRLAGGTVAGYVGQWKSHLAFLDQSGGQWAHAARLLRLLFGEGLLGLAGWPAAAQTAAGAAALLLAGRGASRLLRGPDEPVVFAIACYGVLTLALHATWSALTLRYLIPLVPLAWILLAAAGEPLMKGRPAAAAALTLLLAAPSLRQDLGLAAWAFKRQPVIQPATMAWLRDNTPPSARVESVACTVVMLLADREAVCAASYGNRDEWLASLLEKGVGYAHLVTAFEVDGLFPDATKAELSWAKSSPYLVESYRNGDEGTVVYQVRHPSPARYRKAWAAYRTAGMAATLGKDRLFVRRMLKEAVAEEPELALAWALLAQSEPDAAQRLRYLRKAARSDPNLPGLREALSAAGPAPKG